MTRLLTISVLLLVLAGCSFSPLHRADHPQVIASSQYCGTGSQDSAAHYFDDSGVFEDWINYRSITEFRPSMADNGGVIVVEMGQRPTGGYKITLQPDKTQINNGTLILHLDWSAPRQDAAVSQALNAPCLAIKPPAGDYQRVQVVDQLGDVRGRALVR